MSRLGDPQGIGRTARPGIGGGLLDDASQDRVPVQVAEGDEGVQVVFDHARALPALPEVATAAAGPVEGPRSLRHEPAKGTAEGIDLGCF